MRLEIGVRLREERERLGFSQQAFAEIGGASKRSQVEWEKGAQVPNAEFLAHIATRGADVTYIVTGVRALSAKEVEADLDRYGMAWETLEMALEATGREMSPAKKRKAADALYRASKAQMAPSQDQLVALVLELAA
ncbi:helix-turn-helix domain-containing protein [Achromobacter mucicolens]|uniref:helix-turn-helix domain-containing protein n=1 Tax=Achromobacter mucicolens TaxID=1389922 RepID=UPI0020A43896|nr:helix-turn-helix transcriptional regulator [Achromobacter mucicolens]MCP2517051.1 helix-turn-helix domain-containing protein [Achromobacter mucicolens]